jgi:hypothetical protein
MQPSFVSIDHKPVFSRTITLKDTWARIEKKQT